MPVPKLIACDIDGTLMDYSESAFSPDIFPLIQRLRTKGVLFCPASGRQYSSLKRLFAPVRDELLYLCENGGIVYDEQENVLHKTVMDRDKVMELAHEMMDMGEECEVVFSGADTSYVVLKKPGLDEELRSFTGNNVAVLKEPEDMPEETLKLSAFCPNGCARYYPVIAPKWNDTFPVAIGGPKWLDTALADKGVGMAALSEALGIDLGDVMAFGDNYNDMPMLSVVGMPYVVNRSPMTDIPKHFRRCETVTQVLEEILEECRG